MLEYVLTLHDPRRPARGMPRILAKIELTIPTRTKRFIRLDNAFGGVVGLVASAFIIVTRAHDKTPLLIISILASLLALLASACCGGRSLDRNTPTSHLRPETFKSFCVRGLLSVERITMRAVIIGLVLVVGSISPCHAAEASVQDRIGLSVSISDYIRDIKYENTSNLFRTTTVEIGATVIEDSSALADWRSADGKKHGQVFFYHMCEHWWVEAVSVGRALSAHEIAGRIPAAAATRLVAELANVEDQPVAYLKPARPGGTC